METNTRITIDLQDSNLLMALKWMATHEHKAIREIVVEAIEGYLSHKRENQALMKLAEPVFSEWDNLKDSDYDKL